MDTCSPVKLQPLDIRSHTYLQKRMGGPNSTRFRRFKALLEGGCVPLHIPVGSHQKASAYISPSNSSAGSMPARLRLPEATLERARGIAAKMPEDRLVLTARSADLLGPNAISILAECALESELMAMAGQPQGRIPAHPALRIESSVSLIAAEGTRNFAVVGKQGGRFCALFSHSIEAGYLAGNIKSSDIWSMNALSEIWNLGSLAPKVVRYAGAAAGVGALSGTFTLIGFADGHMTPADIAGGLNKEAGFEIEAIPFRLDGLLAWLEAERHRASPQLITAIAMLCYRYWGNSMMDTVER